MPKPSIDSWDLYQRYFNSELTKIAIPPEIQPGQIKVLTSALNELYDEIFFDYIRYKTLFENIEDLIDEVKTRNLVGSNSEDRKKTGYDAVAEYISNDGTQCNLFEIRRVYRERFNFAKAVIDSIQSKKSSLITDSAVLKIEASLLAGQ